MGSLRELTVARESPYRKQYPPGDAHKYAERTGGFAAAMRGKGVDQRLAEVIDSLRSRYTIELRSRARQAARDVLPR